MLEFLKTRLARHRAAEFPPLAPEEDFIAVGDIHGRNDLLLRLLERLADHPRRSRLVFLGDYIDRGEESGKVLQTLQWLQQQSERVVCLRGNHEEMLLGFLADPAGQGPGWLQHGGRQTLASCGIAPPYPDAPAEDWQAAAVGLKRRLGAATLAWLHGLPASWRSGNALLVHAGADPARPAAAQDEQDLTWGHPDFLRRPRRDGLWVIHGHTIVETVRAEQGRLGVDTGAFATGTLSAVSVTQGKFEVLTS